MVQEDTISISSKIQTYSKGNQSSPAKVNRKRERALYLDKSNLKILPASPRFWWMSFSLPDIRENDPMVAIRDLANYRNNLVRESIVSMFFFTKRSLSHKGVQGSILQIRYGLLGKISPFCNVSRADKERLAPYLRKCSDNRVSTRKNRRDSQPHQVHRGSFHQRLSQLEVVRCEVIRSPLREFKILEKR